MNNHRKLLASLLPLVVFGLAAVGVELPGDWVGNAILVLTPFLVWLFPNGNAE